MKAHTYKIEGIGEDLVPESTWFVTIDEIVKVGDKESYLMTCRLAREEGILAGSSSGAAVVAARRIGETLSSGDVMVVLLPDTGERYLSKAHNEEWLKEQGYLEEPVAPLMTILRAKERTIPGVITIDIAAKVREAADMMRQYNVSQLPVMDTGILVGSLREEILMKALLENPKMYDDYVAKVMEKPFPIVEPGADLEQVYKLLMRGNPAVVIGKENRLEGIITTSLTLLKKGDHVVVTDDCYGGVYRIFTRIMSNYGIESTFVDLRDLVDAEDAFRSETRMLWTESPTNPLMKVVDLRELAVLAKAHDAISVCDNTFASPALQNPLALGVDLVVHSTTKYIGGHADLLGGALVMNRDDLHEKLKFSQNALGAIPSAFDCWLTLRGIKTLAVRMEKHCDNAEALAKFLKTHKAVAKVHYPGLPDDPGHAVAKKQMRRFGGMLSFEARDPSRISARLQRH